jgi:hypothetical protein
LFSELLSEAKQAKNKKTKKKNGTAEPTCACDYHNPKAKVEENGTAKAREARDKLANSLEQ